VERVENPAGSQPTASAVLGIFVKEPRAGEVKTRLCPPLTATQAAELYAIALQETIERMAAGPWSLQLFVAGTESWFAERFSALPRHPQVGSDLGARMQQALQQLLIENERAALIGSDSPDLPLALIKQAFAELASHQAVSVPAADGGYVLIGARKSCPPLFEAIPWSTAGVLQATRERALACGIDYVEIGGWEDIDDANSLKRLLQRSPQAATARYAAALLTGCLDLSPPMTDNRRQL